MTNADLVKRPNEFYGRTDGILLLETEAILGSLSLRNLYTPFGEFVLEQSGFATDSLKASSEFLRTIQWSTREVTEEVKVYDGGHTFKYTDYYNRGQSQLFLITAVHNVPL